ncbi:MAG: 50S ribosomal protein L11 methyltransferase [Bacteroidota bacterium]|nr:50S ribosomal protein L11 methyltransferase [Bacteroidota bacterium]
MEYIEISCALRNDEELQDILIAQLGEIGFESFVQEEEFVKAYIQAELYDEQLLKDVFDTPLFGNVPYSVNLIAERNWNAEWESNYPLVRIDERCMVRAPFHDPDPDVEFDIVIEPKMSFGTAHHDTTSQMLKLLLDEDVRGLKVLDMGCGTGVLAILAMMKGAAAVTAIDNDEWAYENTVENLKRNGISDQKVILGDATVLGADIYHLILANINRNILLKDMHYYAGCLSDGGKLFMSGFYEADLPAIKAEAIRLGMKFVKYISSNNWVAAVFTR